MKETEQAIRQRQALLEWAKAKPGDVIYMSLYQSLRTRRFGESRYIDKDSSLPRSCQLLLATDRVVRLVKAQRLPAFT